MVPDKDGLRLFPSRGRTGVCAASDFGWSPAPVQSPSVARSRAGRKGFISGGGRL